MNVDVSFKVVRKVTALQHFKDLMQGSDKEKVRDMMIGATVMTNYNKKMYVVDDLEFNVRVDSTFEQNGKNGEESISFIDYYEKKWNLQIKDKNQFLIKTTDKKSKKVTLSIIFY